MTAITWRRTHAALLGLTAICIGVAIYPVLHSGGSTPYTTPTTIVWGAVALASLAGSFAAEYQYATQIGEGEARETDVLRYVGRRILFIVIVLMVANMAATFTSITF